MNVTTFKTSIRLFSNIITCEKKIYIFFTHQMILIYSSWSNVMWGAQSVPLVALNIWKTSIKKNRIKLRTICKNTAFLEYFSPSGKYRMTKTDNIDYKHLNKILTDTISLRCTCWDFF